MKSETSSIATAVLGTWLATEKIILEARHAETRQTDDAILDTVHIVALRENDIVNGTAENSEVEFAWSGVSFAEELLSVDL